MSRNLLQQPPPAKARSLSEARINLERAVVLIVQHSEPEMEVIRQMFGGFGVRRVLRAANQTEARQYLDREPIDLVLIENNLPGQDGCDFVREIRRNDGQNRMTSLILMSGHCRKDTVIRGRDCGANFFVAKPLTPRVMMERILWSALDLREFIEAPNYVGPDRRFKNLGPPLGEKGRRSTDLSAHVGEATAPNMDQATIDALFNPVRITR
jgi:CheY-like chemotaxis protein